jgi:actin-like ATPase involved in cell morphogenesis
MKLFKTIYDLAIDLDEFSTRIMLNGKLLVDEPCFVKTFDGKCGAAGKRAILMHDARWKRPTSFKTIKPLENGTICDCKAFEFMFWEFIKMIFERAHIHNNIFNRPVFRLTLYVPSYTIESIKGHLSCPPLKFRIKDYEFVDKPTTISQYC